MADKPTKQDAKQKIKKKDFIELEFVAKIKDGNVFDTNIKQEAEKASLNITEFKPFILSVGHEMVISGLDKSLEGKEIGKAYEQEFSPDNAFGKRNPQLIKVIPMRVFKEQNIQPQPGMQLSLDNTIVRIASVSGGRILVDFNNPLSGKQVIYKFKAKRKITDKKEKINAIQDFFFKQKFDFNVHQDKKTILFKIPKKQEQMQQMIKVFEKPFQEILGLKIKAEIEKQEESVSKNKP
jgi:FKBP-type peptidyl-prolyl cis-trans isomerase 2